MNGEIWETNSDPMLLNEYRVRLGACNDGFLSFVAQALLRFWASLLY